MLLHFGKCLTRAFDRYSSCLAGFIIQNLFPLARFLRRFGRLTVFPTHSTALHGFHPPATTHQPSPIGPQTPCVSLLCLPHRSQPPTCPPRPYKSLSPTRDLNVHSLSIHDSPKPNISLP